ncbi:signal peptidase II [Collinsella sp. zg1085]|uniref:signal peptidase II n=1 Tax=Collinsella sp. zg1085 TaxID=2844380 RepID=UPI00209B0348|nr:signal peptidase II [Collinsella sp. zg1085]
MASFIPARAWRASRALGCALAVIVLDQLTKLLVVSYLAPHADTAPKAVPFLPGLLELRYVENRGAAFSIGEGFSGVFVFLALAITIATIAYLSRAPQVSKLELIGLALVVGGALGNALDRVLRGFVVDFFATTFIDFPVFNVADIAIDVGVVLACIGYMFLSPANRVDATEELNRRDRIAQAKRAAKKDMR